MDSKTNINNESNNNNENVTTNMQASGDTNNEIEDGRIFSEIQPLPVSEDNSRRNTGDMNELSNAKASLQFTQSANNNSGNGAIKQKITSLRTSVDDLLNVKLTIEEKRKLRMDLLSLPPEKLGEIMYVLQKTQPHNIVQQGDEIEIDLKTLNTKTLRHLQRYVQSVFMKIRYSIMCQPNNYNMVNPGAAAGFVQQPQNGYNSGYGMSMNYRAPGLGVSDLLPNGQRVSRKRSFDVAMGNMNMGFGGMNGYKPPRKKRSAFTNKQKEEMITFWSSQGWKATGDDAKIEQASRQIGVSVSQLKVFRQNNRKKYTGQSDTSNSASAEPKNVDHPMKNSGIPAQ